VTRVGTQVVPSPGAALPETAVLPLAWQTPASAYNPKKVVTLAPYSLDQNALIQALLDKGISTSAMQPRPAEKVFRSETGELTIDGPLGCLTLDTSKTAGGYAIAGSVVNARKGGVSISIKGSDATVWVSALDAKTIRDSRRLLVTHLTDLQNTDIRYAEPARQTLLSWGDLPYLVRAGQADVAIKLKSAKRCHVWALSPGGRRLAEVPATADGDSLRFTADVAADAEQGARMLYEVAVAK